MESNQVNLDFAKAWDNTRGTFAENFANKLIEYAGANKIKLKSILDICCGSSNLLRVFQQHGLTCSGTESRKGMFDYSKENNPAIKYYLTENMFEVPIRGSVDLVTCTGDIVNYFESFEDWITFFKNVNKHISGRGIFVFDFYTKSKLKDWNETTYSASQWIDCLTSIKSGLYDKTIINYTYYINYQDYMTKTRDIVVESYFETQDIVNALKQCGFKNVKLVDKDMQPIENLDLAERIHVIAKKR